MFGHQDSNNHDSAAKPATPQTDAKTDAIVNHPGASATTAPTAPSRANSSSDGSPSSTTDSASSSTHSSTPSSSASASPTSALPIPPSISAPSTPPPTLTPPSTPAASHNSTNVNAPAGLAQQASKTGLLELKLTALHDLAPLIDHLEQTAEERFRTMMMMIQASDDQALLSEAYAAAHTIENKKIRAQALLDIINEINYFTQQHSDNEH